VQGNSGEPQYVRSTIADKTAGMYAALAICAELAGRERGSAPRAVKVPMLETIAAFTTVEQLGGYTFEPPVGPALYPRTASSERRPYATSDGYLSVLLYTDAQWSSFLTEVDRADLIEDPAFADLANRTRNVDLVYGFLAEELSRRSTEAWLVVLERLEVPHSKVNSIGDLLHDPHLTAVEMFPRRVHPTEGPIRIARAPFLFDDIPLRPVSFAEELGASTGRFRAQPAGEVGK